MFGRKEVCMWLVGVVVELWLELTILMVFSNLNDSMIPSARMLFWVWVLFWVRGVLFLMLSYMSVSWTVKSFWRTWWRRPFPCFDMKSTSFKELPFQKCHTLLNEGKNTVNVRKIGRKYTQCNSCGLTVILCPYVTFGPAKWQAVTVSSREVVAFKLSQNKQQQKTRGHTG